MSDTLFRGYCGVVALLSGAFCLADLGLGFVLWNDPAYKPPFSTRPFVNAHAGFFFSMILLTWVMRTRRSDLREWLAALSAAAPRSA